MSFEVEVRGLDRWDFIIRSEGLFVFAIRKKLKNVIYTYYE